jgi:hypothetical protein
MAKIQIFIGRAIHRMTPLAIAAACKMSPVSGFDDMRATGMYFPELDTPDAAGSRFPRHIQDTLDCVHAALITAKTHRSEKHPLCIVTHAAPVLNHVGQLISEGALAPEDVTVFLVGSADAADGQAEGTARAYQKAP